MNWGSLEPALQRAVVELSLKSSYYTAVPKHLHSHGRRPAFDAPIADLEVYEIPPGFASVLALDGCTLYAKVYSRHFAKCPSTI